MERRGARRVLACVRYLGFGRLSEFYERLLLRPAKDRNGSMRAAPVRSVNGCKRTANVDSGGRSPAR